jgi:hypothetical protein
MLITKFIKGRKMISDKTSSIISDYSERKTLSIFMIGA